ncbi:MAG TPA: GpE family phage tail protein [Croceibacterium sp.]|nr:GpE family phage tail protein [Croceibacterium sp.]
MQADIAAVFHWSLQELNALGIDELRQWRERAVACWNRMQGKEK